MVSITEFSQKEQNDLEDIFCFVFSVAYIDLFFLLLALVVAVDDSIQRTRI
jgi:hypothetical protein